MSENLALPTWAQDVSFVLPDVTRYAGPSSRAVPWMDGDSRVRYSIRNDRGYVTLSIAEAVAVAEAIIRDAILWSAPYAD